MYGLLVQLGTGDTAFFLEAAHAWNEASLLGLLISPLLAAHFYDSGIDSISTGGDDQFRFGERCTCRYYRCDSKRERGSNRRFFGRFASSGSNPVMIWT